MSRYIRFGYLVPRIVAAVLIFALVEFGAGYVLRSALIDGGQQAIGARVEVAEVGVSLLGAKASVEGLQIANPSDPMQNLLEAERLDLDFDGGSLLRGKAIVDRGVLRGAKFGTPRETSGALVDGPQKDSNALAASWLGGAAGEAGKAWAKKFGGDVEGRLQESLAEFESPELADKLAMEWQSRYESLRDNAESLREDARTFRDEMKMAVENPLRHTDVIAAAPDRLSNLRRQLADVRQDLNTLPSDIQTDRQRIEVARRADEARLRDAFQADQLDPQSLTTQLLGDTVMGPVGEAIGWLRWARQMTPTGKPSPRVVDRRRGVDVRFLGVRERPDLLIRSLDVSGSAQLAGRPVEVSGVVTGLTTQPHLHGSPLQLTLSTTGGAKLEVRGEIDRTSDTPTETVQIDCPNFGVPELTLGPAAGLTLASQPSTGALTVSVVTRGEKLEGVIQLLQSEVALAPAVSGDASRLTRRLADASAMRLGRISQAATRIGLAGTLSAPEVSVWSNLGAAVASSLGGAAEGVIADERDRLLAESRAELDTKLARYEQQLGPMRDAASQVLAGSGVEIDSLASLVTPGGLGRGSLSFESLGKQLPAAGSLFR